MKDRRGSQKKHVMILRFVLRLVAAVAILAFAGSCSNWVLGVVQSFGSPNGPKISTVAGNGTGGYAGDNAAATSAELHQPYAVAVDSSNNLYIADGVNCVIRMVNTSGTITTIAGDYSKAGTSTGDGSFAIDAGLYDPVGVAVDSFGNIYISDSGNQAIRKVTQANGVISKVAGVGAPTTPPLALHDPYGIAVDSTGNLYIADMGDNCILKLDTSGNISTVAGYLNSAGYTGDGGAATSARLNSPTAVAVDALGNIYIADGLNFVIRKVDPIGNISTIAGNGLNGYSGDGGPATAAELNQPWGVAVDPSGNLYISEINSVVRKVDTSGNISTVAGNVHLGAGYGGDGNVATAAMLNEPWGLAIDSLGNLLIADFVNNRIRMVGFGK